MSFRLWTCFKSMGISSIFIHWKWHISKEIWTHRWSLQISSRTHRHLSSHAATVASTSLSSFESHPQNHHSTMYLHFHEDSSASSTCAPLPIAHLILHRHDLAQYLVLNVPYHLQHVKVTPLPSGIHFPWSWWSFARDYWDLICSYQSATMKEIRLWIKQRLYDISPPLFYHNHRITWHKLFLWYKARSIQNLHSWQKRTHRVHPPVVDHRLLCRLPSETWKILSWKPPCGSSITGQMSALLQPGILPEPTWSISTPTHPSNWWGSSHQSVPAWYRRDWNPPWPAFHFFWVFSKS